MSREKSPVLAYSPKIVLPADLGAILQVICPADCVDNLFWILSFLEVFAWFSL